MNIEGPRFPHVNEPKPPIEAQVILRKYRLNLLEGFQGNREVQFGLLNLEARCLISKEQLDILGDHMRWSLLKSYDRLMQNRMEGGLRNEPGLESYTQELSQGLVEGTARFLTVRSPHKSENHFVNIGQFLASLYEMTPKDPGDRPKDLKNHIIMTLEDMREDPSKTSVRQTAINNLVIITAVRGLAEEFRAGDSEWMERLDAQMQDLGIKWNENKREYEAGE